MKNMSTIFFGFLFIQLIVFFAHAEVTASFTENKAVLNIEGNDGDFEHLYEALTATEREEGGTLKKSFELKSSTDETILFIACSRLPNSFNGSCTIELNQWSTIPAMVTMNKEQGFIKLESTDKWSAQDIAKNFISPADLGGIYFSADGKFSIQAQQDHFGKVVKLTIQYDPSFMGRTY